MANNEHNFPVLDASHPDTTNLDEDGMIEPHVAETDDWATLPVHSAADKLPMMSDAELEALAADIKANGLLEPIVVWEDNTEAAKGGEGPFPTYLLDGRNRLAALKLLGITDPHDAPTGKGANYGSGWAVKTHKALLPTTSCGASTPKWLPEVNPVTYVLSRNVHRRHLTSEQKRQAIAAFIKADPTTSDRTVAKELGVDNKTAAKVRADLEAREEIPHVPTRTDSAGRKQPATKRKSTPKPEATAKPEPIAEDTVAEQPITTEPPGGLTENSPGQTDRVKQALENAKAATGAIEPARDDSAIGPPPDDSDTGPDLSIVLSGIAADDRLDDNRDGVKGQLGHYLGQMIESCQDLSLRIDPPTEPTPVPQPMPQPKPTPAQARSQLDATIADLAEQIRVELWRSAATNWYIHVHGDHPIAPPFVGEDELIAAMIYVWQQAVDAGHAQPVTECPGRDFRAPDSPWPGLGLSDDSEFWTVPWSGLGDDIDRLVGKARRLEREQVRYDVYGKVAKALNNRIDKLFDSYGEWASDDMQVKLPNITGIVVHTRRSSTI